jgi:hypothetical protein
MVMSMEQLVEWVAGETEVLDENLPQNRFVHHISHMWLDRGLNHGRRGGKSAINRSS